MRPRKKKNAKSRLEACEYLLIRNPEDHKGNWNKLYNFENPLHLEIGCGKGRFICESAKANPDINYVAFEKEEMVIINALEKCKEYQLTNVFFVLGDAKDLCNYFENGEVKRIYLNFSDPWKKSKQYKRRLTYKAFLDIYKQILEDSEQSAVYFKTDNRPLFDFSLEQFTQNDFRIEKLTYDLHNSPYKGENIMTEYEQRFVSLGTPINRLEAYIK